jgi:activator of 2-hydroxyglutaryl-CoA dehydratase
MFVSKENFGSKKEHGSYNTKMDQYCIIFASKNKIKIVEKWKDVQR